MQLDPIRPGTGPRAMLALVRHAAAAQRTGSTAVVVVLLERERVGHATGLLRFAHALGLRTILEAQGSAVEHLVTRRPELVHATLRAADAILVPSVRTAALVRELAGERLRVEVAGAGGAVQRLQAALIAA